MDSLFECDTIAAISTPAAKGGIGIVRVSGKDSKSIVQRIFTGDIEKSHTIRYGFIFDCRTGVKVDEVLVTYMQAPKSYTCEDIVEINCHSGLAVLNRIMSLLIENGARQAEEGEFTKRAFLNGRIDLSRAEAVIDIINARTGEAAQNAANQLAGRLFDEIKELMDGILLCLSHLEASIDYPEHTDDLEQNAFLRDTINGLLDRAKRLLGTAEIGRIIRDGVNTVIIGETNVGKSSLMNYLAGCERAIVTDIHGTTRDIVEESVNVNGVLLRLSDTAGIRETSDTVEKIGVSRAVQAARSADLILYVLDGTKRNDGFLVDINENNAKVLAIINKADLPFSINAEKVKAYFGADNTFEVSVLNKTGLFELAERIKRLFSGGEALRDNAAVVSNIRHKQSLTDCVRSLENCIGSLDGGFPEDILAIDLMAALKSLGEITGDDVSEELTDKIFSEFCLGK